MNPMEDVKNLITKNIEDAHVEVHDLTGTMDHLEILVVSDVFKGKRLLQQHQLIMDILKEDLKEKIHAVKITTKTKEQFQK
jgi:stress-induced morphogen